MMRTLLLILALSMASGCAMPHRLQLGGAAGPGNKVVSAKDEPATLIAVDGTLCVVTVARFHRVKTGDRVWCNWRPRGEG